MNSCLENTIHEKSLKDLGWLWLEKRRLREETRVFKDLKGYCEVEGYKLFSMGIGNEIRNCGLNMKQGRFSLI